MGEVYVQWLLEGWSLVKVMDESQSRFFQQWISQPPHNVKVECHDRLHSVIDTVVVIDDISFSRLCMINIEKPQISLVASVWCLHLCFAIQQKHDLNIAKVTYLCQSSNFHQIGGLSIGGPSWYPITPSTVGILVTLPNFANLMSECVPFVVKRVILWLFVGLLGPIHYCVNCRERYIAFVKKISNLTFQKLVLDFKQNYIYISSCCYFPPLVLLMPGQPLLMIM